MCKYKEVAFWKQINKKSGANSFFMYKLKLIKLLVAAATGNIHAA